MSIISVSDFTGYFHRLSQSEFKQDSQTTLITSSEGGYLAKILGKELADLFYADLDANNEPQTARFISIFNPFIEQYNKCIYESKGLKYALTGFIYYEFVANENIRSTDVGLNKSSMENATSLSQYNLLRQAEIRYNDSIESVEAIQKYICENASTYPEYDGVKFKPYYSSML